MKTNRKKKYHYHDHIVKISCLVSIASFIVKRSTSLIILTETSIIGYTAATNSSIFKSCIIGVLVILIGDAIRAGMTKMFEASLKDEEMMRYVQKLKKEFRFYW